MLVEKRAPANHSEYNNQQISYFNDTSHCNKTHQYTLDDIKRIAHALGKAKRYRDGYTCCCPVHPDREPSLSIFLSDKYPLGLMCYAGCNPKNIYKTIQARGLAPRNQTQTHRLESSSHYHASKEPIKKLNTIISPALNSNLESINDTEYRIKLAKETAARKLWKMALDPANSPVETYLRARGIQVAIPATIRYAPRMKHTLTDTWWPCMVAIVTRWPDRHLVAIHRTYLSHGGTSKAPIDKSKMMLSSVSGGAVRLTPMGDGNILMLGEGIETTLSVVSSYPDCAIWAVLSASNYYNLVLPELPFASTIIVAADNDVKGMEAAERAAKKWTLEGRIVKIATPPKDTDFNDILCGDLS